LEKKAGCSQWRSRQYGTARPGPTSICTEKNQNRTCCPISRPAPSSHRAQLYPRSTAAAASSSHPAPSRCSHDAALASVRSSPSCSVQPRPALPPAPSRSGVQGSGVPVILPVGTDKQKSTLVKHKAGNLVNFVSILTFLINI
jgi:hypothetical protein